METTTEDKPVTSSDPAPVTVKEHYEAAKAAQSKDQGAAASDDTPAKQTAEDPAKVADQPADATEDTDALLTPEEVAQLSPQHIKLYEKAQKNYTLKTQKLAAERRALEDERNKLTEAQAARQTQTQDTAVEQKTAETLSELPAELQFLKPVFDSYGKKLLDAMRGEVAPIKEAYIASAKEAAEAETTSTLEAFSAKYPGWEKHEPAMLTWMAKFVPQKGAMKDFEYMESAYKSVTAGVTQAEQTKKIVEKINAAPAKVEPNQAGVPTSRVEQKMPPPEKRSLRDAWDAAKRGEVWQK